MKEKADLKASNREKDEMINQLKDKIQRPRFHPGPVFTPNERILL